MEYLVPALAVVVIGALTLMAARWLGGRPASSSSSRGASPRSSTPLAVSVERAREAAGLLGEEEHRAVYGHIAQNRLPDAMKDYRRFTGRSLMDAVVDVQSLALHPQVYSIPEDLDDASSATGPAEATEPAEPARLAEPRGVGEQAEAAEESTADGRHAEGGSGESAAGPEGAGTEDRKAQTTDRPALPGEGGGDVQKGGTAPEELTGLTVPAEWTAEPAPEERPFEAQVQRGDEAVTLSSQDLSPWLRDQLSAMVRDGNLESAAVLLSSHSSLSVPEAFELLRHMKERRDGRH